MVKDNKRWGMVGQMSQGARGKETKGKGEDMRTKDKGSLKFAREAELHL